MSMLSAQCDELRTLTDLYDILHKPANARTLRDAADTILSLRDRAQALQTENAKLQASNEVIAEDHAALCEQNAKLRELVADMWLQLLNAYDRKEVDEFADRMREMGLEVG